MQLMLTFAMANKILISSSFSLFYPIKVLKNDGHEKILKISFKIL